MSWKDDDGPPAAVLTRMLQGGTALRAGRVVRAELIDRKPAGAMGSVHAVAVTYSPESRGKLPERVILKRTRPDTAFSPNEVRFYLELLPQLPAGTAPECFGAAWDGDTRQYALILEDLSESHACLLGPGLPAIGRDQVGYMMDRLAALHAAWWERPLQGFGRRAGDAAGTTGRMMPRLAEGYRDHHGRLGDTLTSDHERLYSDYLAKRPRALADRLRSGDAFALLHGDAHVGNFLFPRGGGASDPDRLGRRPGRAGDLGTSPTP